MLQPSSLFSVFTRAWSGAELSAIEHGVVQSLKGILYFLVAALLPLVLPQVLSGHFTLAFSAVNWGYVLQAVILSAILLGLSSWFFAQKNTSMAEQLQNAGQNEAQNAAIEAAKVVAEPTKPTAPPAAEPKA